MRTCFSLILALSLLACSRAPSDGLLQTALPDPSSDADAGVPPPADAPPAPAGPGGVGGDAPSAPPPDETCAVETFESTLTRVPADVIWVVDDSGSMSDEQARIRENIASFAERITSAGADAHVTIVTEDDLAQGTALAGSPAYLFVDADVGSHDSLEVLLEEFDAYAPTLRADAETHFVVVSDDESDLAAARFQREMEALLGKPFTFHAIASENVGGDACDCGQLFCGAAAPGDEYYALADQTGGAQVSICTLDWGAVFDRLVAAVLSGAPLPCTFPLPTPPGGEQLDPGRVRFDYELDGAVSEVPKLGGSECGVLTAWRYDNEAAPSQIELCPSACDSLSAQGKVRIALGCSPVVVE